MSNRAAVILAVAAVISSLCLYGSFAQAPERDRGITDGAIVVGQAPLRLEQEFPGRYQLTRLADYAVVVIDTHTGQCWRKSGGGRWEDLGSPVKEK